MSSVHNKIDGTASSFGTKLEISAAGLAVIGFCFEVLVIVSVSVLTGIGYHMAAYGATGPIEFFFGAGGLAALIYMLPFLLAEHYRVQDFLDGRRGVHRGFLVWNYTFLCLSIFAFVTKTTEDFSRGWVLLFYVCGIFGVIGFEAMFRRLLRSLMAAGRITRRRMMLVGESDEIRRFASDPAMRRTGVRIVATIALPRIGAPSERETSDEVLAASVASARSLRVDDVVILTDWSRAQLMERVLDAYSSLPAEIHLGASSVIGRFTDARVSRFSSLTALSLTAPALGPLQSMAKRATDVIGSALALALLSPLFLVVSLLIKFDSRGPVFFRQRRAGFNQHQFRIWKFRTMTTMDDGETVVQAQRHDPRVTRIGQYLRRWNIDELPQLINVLKGEMSLVGPRPHAVAHDLKYGKAIATYTRRLNVLPGITGWAQVNGSRGPTETEAAMRQRVEFDLHYIENWSIALDLYILALTLFSPKAFRNAL